MNCLVEVGVYVRQPHEVGKEETQLINYSSSQLHFDSFMV